MASLFKEKKGVEGSGLVVGIVILLISAGIILWVVYASASKANENVIIKTCRISNEIRVGTEDYSHWFLPLHSPRICDTIYKTEPKLQIPDRKTSQDKKGAEEQIGDMLKNCWYMWLEGSDPKVFPKGGIFYWFGGQGCHVCYVFKVKDINPPVTFEGVMNSLNQRTYSAVDSSDGCAPNNGGGFLRDNCNPTDDNPADSIPPEVWKSISSKLADSQHKKCCIKEDDLDECGNKGGKCGTPTGGGPPDAAYPHIYDKWMCPEPEQECYVKEDYYYSYLDYLTDTYYSKRGGAVNEPPGGLGKFTLSGVNAISIYSGDSNNVGDVFLRISSLDYATGDGHCAIS